MYVFRSMIIEAPIAKGDHIADLIVTIPGMQDKHIPLVASDDVGRGGFIPRIRTATQVILAQFTGAF